jgi:uncharacterized protein (DUF427 family)
MGLMTGSGPLGREPAGTFNFEPPAPGRALYLEPTPKRIRVQVADETIADSRRALLLHESGLQPVYYFPPDDVRHDVLEPTAHHTHCPKKGDASYYTIRVGDRVVDNGAWYYPDTIANAPPLQGLIAFYWDRMDHWLEEEVEVFSHPRDPYHRVDALRTSRRIRVLRDGELLAESDRAVAVFESNLPARWYLPRDDVLAVLEPSDRVTRCPYKGRASYQSVRLAGGDLVKDLVWSYPEPLAEAAAVADMLCFFNERVDLFVDGELQARPASPGRHGVRPDAHAGPVVETRG